MTLVEAAQTARDQSGATIVYVTHTKLRGYQVETLNVRCRNAVQAWAHGKRWDLAPGYLNDFDMTTESAKGSIR